MHKIIIWFFENLNNIGQTLSITCSFLIMTTVLYWLESILNAQWNWLNFIKPVLDVILNFTNSILPFSINAFGTVFDGRFITAAIFLMCLMVIFRLILEGISNLRDTYEDLHYAHKKAVEKEFNKQMTKKVVVKEKRISKYMILIKTKVKKKFNHEEININISEQNDLMNDFIYKKTYTKHEDYEGGFLYQFEDFNQIDNILDVMFKVLKSNSPLDYFICIQTGSEKSQLDRLLDLEYYGKIIFCADTLLRYKCNKSHRYGTQNVGVFQQGENTIEVHEFYKI